MVDVITVDFCDILGWDHVYYVVLLLNLDMETGSGGILCSLIVLNLSLEIVSHKCISTPSSIILIL